jgi:hypothetical protein
MESRNYTVATPSPYNTKSAAGLKQCVDIVAVTNYKNLFL